MKSVKINEDLFLKAIKQISRTVATDASRPALQRCRVEVTEQKVFFMSCDGYRATRVIYLHRQENVEPFVCSFNAFLWKAPKGSLSEVVISQEGDTTTFSYEENGGKIERHFSKDSSDYIDLHKIMDSQCEPVVRVAFNAALVLEIDKLRNEAKVKDVALELASHRAAMYQQAYLQQLGRYGEDSKFSKEYFLDLADNIVHNKGGTANADS